MTLVLPPGLGGVPAFVLDAADNSLGTSVSASTSSTSFVAIGDGTTTGFVVQSFTAPTSRVYTIFAAISAVYPVNANFMSGFAIFVDGAQVGNEVQHWSILNTEYFPVYLMAQANLSSGSHTVEVRWKVYGASTINVDGSFNDGGGTSRPRSQRRIQIV